MGETEGVESGAEQRAECRVGETEGVESGAE